MSTPDLLDASSPSNEHGDSSTPTAPSGASPALAAALRGKDYWRSLDELADTAPFRDFVERRLPQHAEELVRGGGGIDRRKFLQLMAASLSLAGLSGCRRPSLKILPYTRKPEDVIEGMPTFYATALPRPGGGLGVLVESHEGRPTKIEGNPNCPAGKGSTDAQTQAEILDLYDPDRSRQVLKEGLPVDWDTAIQAITEHFIGLRDAKGKGLRILAEDYSSPSLDRLRARFKQVLPEARWHVYEPLSSRNALEGATLAFGSPLIPRYQFEKASVILALGSDFLHTEDESARHLRGWADSRRVTDGKSGEMNRLYVVENRFTVTGGMADHRLRLAASQIADYTLALAKEILGDQEFKSVTQALGGYSPGRDYGQWIKEVAKDLADTKNAGRGIVIAGREQPPIVHALAHAINARLGSHGSTITFLNPTATPPDGDIVELAQAMAAGDVDSLLILGGNPLFNAPVDLGFDEALAKVKTSFRWGLYVDETSQRTNWHLPAAHWLESWGDARSIDGTAYAMQPMIEPLFGGRELLSLVAIVVGHSTTQANEIVQETFKTLAPDATSFDVAWRKFLQDGVYTKAPKPPIEAKLNAESIAKAVGSVKPTSAPALDAMELVFAADPQVGDGRYNNNGWLQETPNPITKLTWDNAAWFSPTTAKALEIDNEDVVRIEFDGRTLEMAAMVVPGHADNSVTVTVGYGRRIVGRVGEGTGFDTYSLRTSRNLDIATGVRVAKTGAKYPLAVTQEHHTIPGDREEQIIHEQEIKDYRAHGDGFGHGHHGGGHASESEHSEGGETSKGYVSRLQGGQILLSPTSPPYGNGNPTRPIGLGGKDQVFEDLQERPAGLQSGDHQWGMVIDLNTCVGCNACMVACQSENNIPIVGKGEVRRGREMHWIRNDRYFAGDENDPTTVNQPVGCQHCENAPCELVCPVNATIHSDDGLNLQAYNRCVGTRYCANNCPYKVRRFNWFNYNERPLNALRMGPLTQKGMDETLKMQKNPDVTIRIRGVMEKCTYCIQRVERGKIGARVAAGQSPDGSVKVPDGAVVTACAQACPAQAIVFGDVLDPNSKVSKLKALDRNYSLLTEVNTKPRTTYLSRLRNPNPNMSGGSGQGVEEHS